jgi:hypothetical protein
VIGLWHAIWPGWSALAAQVFIGVLTLPITFGLQLLLMAALKRWNRRHIAAEVQRQVAAQLAPLLSRLHGLETANDLLSKRLQRGQITSRSSAFRGW